MSVERSPNGGANCSVCGRAWFPYTSVCAGCYERKTGRRLEGRERARAELEQSLALARARRFARVAA